MKRFCKLKWPKGMSLAAMSARDLQRIEVLAEVQARRQNVTSAATVLAISDRKVNRFLVRYHDGGGGALIHRARGRGSNNQLESGVREYSVELIWQSYRDFGPTLATEVVHERHGIIVAVRLSAADVRGRVMVVAQAAASVPSAAAST